MGRFPAARTWKSATTDTRPSRALHAKRSLSADGAPGRSVVVKPTKRSKEGALVPVAE